MEMMACGILAGAAHSLVVGEGFVDPLGFHDPTPAFSWKLPVGVERQTAYCLEVRDLQNQAMAWDSGWVESGQSVLVPYGGKPLASRQRLAWRVRFRDGNETDSGWSETATFELGLLSAGNWKAQWIRPETEPDPAREPVAWLRRKFSVSGNVERARLYVTARGVFEVSLNGARVGSDHFANGWTSYKHRLDTLTYDVTKQLRAGGNTLCAKLGTGWFSGRLTWENLRNVFGPRPELLLQLEVAYADGTVEAMVSDENWEATFDGPVLSSSIYDGEEYDARKEVSGWGGVAVNPDPGSARLIPKPFIPVRATETLVVKKITEPEPGRFVFDLGQNMVGWAKLKIPVEKDQAVTIRFAEMLNPDGTIYTANYRSAKSVDTYVPAETGTVEWEPSFTFHGFRYVELSGLPAVAKPSIDWVEGIVLHSDLPRLGTFESSHEKLNQLQSNIVWSQRGNFVDIPTDCPQRDERLGWTGDAQVFCPASMFNYDCHAFWKSWLGSMRDDQFEDGRVPHVVPDVLWKGDSPGWMDAATFIPWEIYVRTGDADVLVENLEMMERLVGFYRSQSKDRLIGSGSTEECGGFNDWLQPYALDAKGDTPVDLLTTAYYARSTQILADAAQVLGKDAEARRCAEEAAGIRRAFAKHYFDGNGKLRNTPETQTAYLLSIAFDLIPAELQEKAADHLVRLVHDAGDHLRTGFLGTPYIASVLDRTGHADLAYAVLFKETYPSWFYSINQGATTMWERWNSYSHKDGFGNVEMNSFNHYAYGAISQWVVERIAGLAPDPAHPGYKHFFIRPVIGAPLDWASAELETPYGKASSGWKREGGEIVMEVVVPPNATATIEFPNDRKPETVVAGGHRFELEIKE